MPDLVGAAFSPRVHPRPEYTPLTKALTQFSKHVFFQSGVCGTIVAVLLYPYFQIFCEFLRHQLGDYSSDAVIFSIFLSLVHTLTYVIVNGTFGLFDAYGYFQEYKLARKPYMTPKKSLVIKTLLEAAFGQLLLNPILTYYMYFAAKKFGMMDINDPLPSPSRLFMTFVIAHIFNGFWFYWAHRIFHMKALYATFHKQHHEFTGTMGIAAEYANPVEQIFANMLPSLGGVIFFSTHPLVVGIWLFFRLQQTFEAHSGYCFANTLLDRLWLTHADEAIHHDYHHTVNSGNFGTEWMDWLCGTQDGYMALGGQEGYLAKKSNPNKREVKKD